MNHRLIPAFILLATSAIGRAQSPGPGNAPQEESRYETRYSVNVINDATFYGGLSAPLPRVLNQVLVEPAFAIRERDRWSFSSSLIGLSTAYSDTNTQLRVRETYANLSAGNFDVTAGRKMLLWGTGYAFTAAGVLDPPRIPTDPSDRLNVNEGRDLVKADWIHGTQAISAAWSTAALAPANTNLHDTAAFRYNVLVRGFDTSLIGGHDRGGDSFGALTFTRVVGQAVELHGEAAWREHPALLLGAKYTAANITFIGEFFTPPNIPYFRDPGVSPLAGRQHYVFLNAGKARLRERPGWKQWGVSGSVVANLSDHSYTGILDVSRWFGNHFSAYVHMEAPQGSATSEFGAAPYTAATSAGVRFQL
ncbi:exported hypothetical protein [Candidatus Sulfotelmatomonas gaucii]|uniref:Alginate export domain-containing protein n=1 Tax=Candidatus Sulfuritelmatomonas gaucii TaxID=2043161 RepID=A0A2N9LSW9_9BACT|nr:exported hypothetical protein [Candidatus Sulfotelmatomonas gaucii]